LGLHAFVAKKNRLLENLFLLRAVSSEFSSLQVEMKEQIFNVTPETFDSLALEIFRFQFANNPVYKTFAEKLGRTPDVVNAVSRIPFLPVELFKTHKIYASEKEPEIIFTSSGTTGQITSKHYVADVSLYEKSFLESFHMFCGLPDDYVILALLPSYLEREGSSLVYMADRLIHFSHNSDSGFYLNNYEALFEKLKELIAARKQVLLLGVTYALLDLAEKFPQDLSGIEIMETGGMKGKRKEMIREEVHSILKNAFQIPEIYSEYGMTELLSQAYSFGDGIFSSPPWMKILIREMNDPFSFAEIGKTGGVNIIDFANLYSCSFISTSDLGKTHADGSFEIIGRFDDSDVRGCNLMVE
jgi:phenylacetate-coenzyme A ligase PaaK-like adenylate-forming protein